MKQIIAGYPIVVGNKRMSVLLHSGPADYTPYDENTLLGGDRITAREFGLKFLDAIIVCGATPADGRSVQVINWSETRTGVQVEDIPLVWREFNLAQVAVHEDCSEDIVRLIGIGE